MKKVKSMQQLQAKMSEAVSLHQQGDLIQAERNYIQALDYVPEDAQINYLLGLLYGQRAKYIKAKKYLAKAVSNEPGNAEYLNHYGLALAECGEHEYAVSMLRRSCETRRLVRGRCSA